jgi:sugar lactone lactonase YvrE
MTSDGALYRVNTSDGSRTLIARLPQLTSFHGLVAASDGNFYISTNSSDPGPGNHDRIYKVTPQGAVSILAELPASCLQGLAQESDGDLLGTMRCSGALYRVHLNGSWETLLPGNGMATPQAMAFNLEGELLVNNDESGRIVKITHGGGAFFAQVISFIPPYGFFAYLPSGDFYFSEAAPGFEPRLSRISPTGQVTQVTKQLNFPSGLAFDTTGNLFAVENLSGKISRVSPNGTINPFINNLTRPQALVSDGLGYLYVGDYDGPLQNPDDPAENPTSNRIWKVDLQGNRTLIASHDLQTMTISPAKELYITGSVGYYRGVLRVNPDGSLTPLAIGFLNPVGLAFDVAGNLYVSDDIDNSITRITGFPHGLLQGRISSASTHAPIQGAAISVVTRYPMVLGERTISDSAGDYQLTVAQGQYNLTATAAGFCAKTVQDVIVYAGNLNDVHLALEPCPRLFLPRLLKRY